MEITLSQYGKNLPITPMDTLSIYPTFLLTIPPIPERPLIAQILDMKSRDEKGHSLWRN